MLNVVTVVSNLCCTNQITNCHHLSPAPCPSWFNIRCSQKNSRFHPFSLDVTLPMLPISQQLSTIAKPGSFQMGVKEGGARLFWRRAIEARGARVQFLMGGAFKILAIFQIRFMEQIYNSIFVLLFCFVFSCQFLFLQVVTSVFWFSTIDVKSYYAKKQDFMKEVEKRKQLLHLINQQGDKPTDIKVSHFLFPGYN